MELGLLKPLGIALGLGLLVGLEREWSDKEIAGIRTFPLIAILGVLCAALGESFGGWAMAAALVGLAALMIYGNVAKIEQGIIDPGLTTEVAALVMFAVGAILYLGHTVAAVIVGGGVAVLLRWKGPLHGFVDRIGEQDLRAIIRLVLIALVIAPLLPDRSYGPYDVINPFQIWLMVVLIEGITLGAYLAYRLLGTRGGTFLAGLLGGLISSTATSVSYARQSRETPRGASAAALVILIASTVVFARVGIEIAVVAPGILRTAGPPLLAIMALMMATGVVAYWLGRRELADPIDEEAPSELGAAIVFGLLYAVILLAVAAAKEHFGDRGLYVVAALSGLTDMDAITLSTAKLASTGRLEADLAWRLILIGALANLLFKGAVVGVLGHRRLFLRVAGLFAVALAGGVAILVFWP